MVAQQRNLQQVPMITRLPNLQQPAIAQQLSQLSMLVRQLIVQLLQQKQSL